MKVEFSMYATGKLGRYEKKIVMEILKSIKRARADTIITYFTKDMARWIKE